MAADVARRPYRVEFASQTDITRALLAACAMPADERRRLQRNARRSMAENFAPQRVAALVAGRLADIAAACGRVAARDR
jgi:hypothetical protein